MATIEEELRSAMLADSGITALVSSRIYPDLAPLKPTLPCVVYERVNTVPDEFSFSLDGPGLYRTTVVLSCLASGSASSLAVARAIRSALENKQGQLTNTQEVELILMKDLRDEGFNDLSEIYRFDLDLEIVHL